MRDIYDDDSRDIVQSGEGPIQFVTGLMEKGLKGRLATKMKRRIFKDPLQMPGENHIPQIKKGKIVLGNFGGPGTRIVKRLKRGDKPKTYMDKISKAHDIRYSLAGDVDDVRAADMKMMRKAEEGIRDIKRGRRPRKPPANRINLRVAEKGMKLKMMLEDKGKLPRDKYAPTGDIKEADKPLLRRELKKLEQQGFGVGGRLKVYKRGGGKGIPVEGLMRKLTGTTKPVNTKLLTEFFTRYVDILRRAGVIPKGVKRISKKKLQGLIGIKMKGSGVKDIPVKVVDLFVKLIQKMIKHKLSKQKGKGIRQDIRKMLMRTVKVGRPSFMRGIADRF